jgi:hypothetical protein
MLALTSVWVALGTFILAAAMIVHRPVMTDTTIPVVLWFGAPGAICLAGVVLWAYRKEGEDDPGIVAQRRQAKVAISFAVLAAGMVYGLIIGSYKFVPN